MNSKEIKQLALQRLDELLPDLCLEEGGHTGSLQLLWHSPLHWADCSEPHPRNRCQSFVSEKVPNTLLDCNQNSINVFDYIARENGRSLNRADSESWHQFAQWLADRLGTTYERGGRSDAAEDFAGILEEGQQVLQEICQRMHSRLVDTTDQLGAAARSYLATRGPLWSGENLKQHENYGACTAEDCAAISNCKGFQRYLHYDAFKTCISWTTGQGGIITCFKLIDTRTKEELAAASAAAGDTIARKKYSATTKVEELEQVLGGTHNLGGFSGTITAKSVFIIEGQEDCDSMEMLGVKNIYSIGRRQMSLQQAEALAAAGVVQCTIFRDTEDTLEKRQANAEDTRRNMHLLAQCGISSCCVEIGAPVGQKADADSWANMQVQQFGLDAAKQHLQDILREQTETAAAFVFPMVCAELGKQLEQEGTSRQQMPAEVYQQRLAHAVAEECGRLTKYDAGALAAVFTQRTGADIPASALVAAAEEQRAAASSQQRAKSMQQLANKMQQRLEAGDTAAADAIAKQLAGMGKEDQKRQQLLENIRDWSRSSVEEVARFMRVPATTNLQTKFYFTPIAGYEENGTKLTKGMQDQWTAEELEKYRLTFAAGAVHLVCGRSGHGKSTMLRTMAVDAALQIKTAGRCVVYFSWEESKEAIMQQMLAYYSTLRHWPLQRWEVDRLLNDASLYAEMQGQGAGAHAEDIRLLNDFRQEVLEHLQIIYCPSWSVETMQAQLAAFDRRGLQLAAVFGDYLQRIDCEETAASAAVTYKIKAVVNKIADEAKQRLLPIVMGAQLVEKGDNRAGVAGPHELGNNKIADSSDAVRTADTILMLFNSNELDAEMPAATITLGKGEDKAIKDNPLFLGLQSMGYQQGTGGHLFARITKDREGGRKGRAAVFVHNGPYCHFESNGQTLQTDRANINLLQTSAEIVSGKLVQITTNPLTGETSKTERPAPTVSDLIKKK